MSKVFPLLLQLPFLLLLLSNDQKFSSKHIKKEGSQPQREEKKVSPLPFFSSDMKGEGRKTGELCKKNFSLFLVTLFRYRCCFCCGFELIANFSPSSSSFFTFYGFPPSDLNRGIEVPSLSLNKPFRYVVLLRCCSSHFRLFLHRTRSISRVPFPLPFLLPFALEGAVDKE